MPDQIVTDVPKGMKPYDSFADWVSEWRHSDEAIRLALFPSFPLRHNDSWFLDEGRRMYWQGGDCMQWGYGWPATEPA